MRVDIKIDGDFGAMMRSDLVAGERAVSRAIAGATTRTKTSWRGLVVGAGLGTRLGNTIRSKVYPAGEPSLNAAGIVYSKAPHIISAHDDGAIIRSRNGFWLAIPQKVAGKGPGGRRMTPGEWENKTGRRLRFVYRTNRTALLVDDGTIRKGHAPAFGARKPRGFKNRTMIVFVLVPQVKLKKRFDLARAVAQNTAGLAAEIVANWRSTR